MFCVVEDLLAHAVLIVAWDLADMYDACQYVGLMSDRRLVHVSRW